MLKGLNKKSIATQGAHFDQLTNYTYLLGSEYAELFAKLRDPKIQMPANGWDQKLQPDSMPPTHPLRKTLKTHDLSLLSPTRALFFANNQDMDFPILEKMLDSIGGYDYILMSMMVHEMFHQKQNSDQVNGLSSFRKVPVDFLKLREQLKSDLTVQSLVATYMRLVFSIADRLKTKTPASDEVQLISDLQVVIKELKANYPNVWNFIWDYEYTEGFAQYVAAYSMVVGQLISLEKRIDLEKVDPSENNFTYRTGEFGGLYIAYRLHKMPFQNNDDHFASVWELIARETRAPISPTSLQEIIAKYQGIPINMDEEIKRATKY